MRDKKVYLYGREGGKEFGRGEEKETICRLYCMRKWLVKREGISKISQYRKREREKYFISLYKLIDFISDLLHTLSI